jgi:hypothetical protein
MEVENPKKLERSIYENALLRMETLGTKAIMQPKLLEKREAIKTSLLSYYESTEEYEKCRYVNEFFLGVERELSLLNLINSLTKEE